MSLKDFKLGKNLGKGSFGSVQIVERKTDNKKYAMKRVKMNKLSEKDKKNALNEIRILASLKHKNIIGYKEAFFDEPSNTLNIVMEYADDGDISSKIKTTLQKKLIFDENTIWNWLIQLLEGIKYLHDNKIMHRDLKSANLFLCKNGMLKIGDLNVSTIAKNDFASTKTGTPYYASPEIWNEKPYNYKCDIWSAGCIIYEICNLRPPFRGTNFKELYDNICLGKYSDIKSNYSNDLRNILKLMIVVNPDMRYDAKSILECEIIKKKIKEINFNQNDSNNYYKPLLMQTIKLPKNMSEINKNLPKRYLERTLNEEEMMQNDEYETLKQTFYKSIMDSEKMKDKNQILNNNKNNNNNNNNNNSNNNNNNNNSNNNNNNNNNNNMIEGSNIISNNLHKSNNSYISNNSNNSNNNNFHISNISNNSNNSNQSNHNHRYSNNLINANINIKSDYYNKKTSNSIQGVENDNSNSLKNSNIIDYNKKNPLINSCKSNSETTDNSKINLIDNNKGNNNNYDKSQNNKNNQQNEKNSYIYSSNKKMYVNTPTSNPDKNNSDNQKKDNEQFPIGNENKINKISSPKINSDKINFNNQKKVNEQFPIGNENKNNNISSKKNYGNINFNNNNNNNNNQLNFIPSPKSNPIKIHRANTNISNQNKLNLDNQLSPNEKNNNANQINNEKSFPKKNRHENSNQKNQNNLLNYRQNRPQSVGMHYQIFGNNNNMNNNNIDNINNNNNNMNNNNNYNNNNILNNKNYVNQYIEKEKELKQKKMELNEINKNIRLLDFRQNNNVNNINEGFRIKRSPSNPNPFNNPNFINKEYYNNNNYNFPIFQYKKNQINPNRKVSYGRVQYQKNGNVRHYYNIPIQLKYNNINNIKFNNNNNNNINYNKRKNNINNNNYIIEKFNNNNYGMKNKISRDGPRVFIRHELK